MTETYRLIGGCPSPYSVKMRALLRYRRIPFTWERRAPHHEPLLAAVRPPTMPYLISPDGTVRNDSTLLIQHLETVHAGRSVYTGHAALDFISHLIEDCADEWGTRIMAFHRWNFEDDQAFCSQWVADEMNAGRPRAVREQAALQFRARQTGRLLVLGATPASREILTSTFDTVLDALHHLLDEGQFLFGSRPALADFGWFGQLYQMVIDPTGSRRLRERAPDLIGWLLRLDDASGVEGSWHDLQAPLQPGTQALLRLALQVHLPLLQANAAAAAAGDPVCRVQLLGLPYEQATNKYHVKLLEWLQQAHAALPPAMRERVATEAHAAGCEPPFEKGVS